MMLIVVDFMLIFYVLQFILKEISGNLQQSRQIQMIISNQLNHMDMKTSLMIVPENVYMKKRLLN